MLLDIESIFPFVRSAQRFTGSYTRMLSKKELIAPFYGYDTYPVFGGFPAKASFRFYKLHPLNLYVFAEENLYDVKELNRQLYSEGSKIEALIDVVDYAEILRYVTLDEDNLMAKLNISDFSDSISIVKEAGEIVSLWYTKSSDEIKGLVNSLLTASVLGAFAERDKAGLEYHGPGVSPVIAPVNPEAKDATVPTPAIPTPTTEAIGQFTEQLRKFRGQGEELYEAPLPNAGSGASPGISGGTLDPVETWLRQYLLKRSDDAKQVATLIGPTAVAKSALVKKLAKELGYRLVDFRCLHGDTEIKLIDGTSKKIKDIPAGDKVWVYSCKKDGTIFPALATALGVTRENASFVEVEIDNGEKVRVTPDHKFILRDGSECEAKDLISGILLMSGRENRDCKVVSAWVVEEISNAYCLNVPEYHNFALSSGVFVRNCAFVERSDFEGMKKFATDDETQRMMSYSASMDKMITATDDFQEFATQKYVQIEKYLTDTPDIPKDEKDTIEALRKKFEEWKKPVLLFLDEINRAPQSVIATLTAILNQKIYNNHSMKQCSIVCAANAPIGLDPSIHDIYATTMINDPAAAQRFESINVNPKDVYGRWKKYIQGAGWHKSVVDFVDTPEKAYSIDVLADIYKKYGDGQEKRAALDPFPHYRSWEFVSNHVNAVEEKKDFFNPVFITNLIGENAVSSEYLKYLKTNYKSIVKHVDDSPGKEEDEFKKGIRNCVGSGNAMMMITPTSYGKTSRVNEVCKDMALDPPFVINMSQKDRVDVMGAPKTINTIDYALEDLKGKLPETHPLYAQLKDPAILGQLSLPEEVTVFAPDIEFTKRIRKLKKGQKLVVFFDELNRAQQTAMSSVFEAISDQKLFGVQFEPGQVVVLQAMNYGDRYEGANTIDSAFSGRSAMYVKLSYTDKDATDYLAGIKSEGYSSVILDYLASKTPDELVKMFMHVEAPIGEADDVGFGHGAPTFRGWSTLNKSIKHMDNISFCGAVLDYDGSVESRMIQPLPRDMAGLTDRAKFLLDLVPQNWAGYDPTIDPVEYGGVKYSVKDFVQSIYDTIDAAVKGDYKDAASLGNTLSACLSKLLSIDNQVKIFRTKGITSILGEKYAPEFLTFFNGAMGRSSLELSDVIDEVTATKYIRKLFSLQTDQLKVTEKIASDAVAHAEIFKANVLNQQYFFRGIVDVVMDERHAVDFFFNLVTSAEGNNDFYEWFNRLFLDSTFATYVMSKFGMKDPDMVNAVLTYNKQKAGRDK